MLPTFMNQCFLYVDNTKAAGYENTILKEDPYITLFIWAKHERRYFI